MTASAPRWLAESLSVGQIEKLKAYVELLDKWRKVTNLVSPRDFQHVWERHVWDSVCLLRAEPTKRLWLDFGSGAGFPGVVVGVMLADDHDARVICVESDGRKCAFLRHVVRDLQIPVKIIDERAENVRPASTGRIDVVTARAFGSLPMILNLGDPFLNLGAIALLPRGRTAIAEVADVDQDRYSVAILKNPAAEDAVFLRISKRGEAL